MLNDEMLNDEMLNDEMPTDVAWKLPLPLKTMSAKGRCKMLYKDSGTSELVRTDTEVLTAIYPVISHHGYGEAQDFENKVFRCYTSAFREGEK
jgi:hypothetical protein